MAHMGFVDDSIDNSFYFCDTGGLECYLALPTGIMDYSQSFPISR